MGTAEYVYGFVCEIPLDTCYTDLATTRDTWQRTNVDETASMECPAGYEGDQTRYCNALAVFQDPYTLNCSAVVDSDGWTDDTASDGFGWSDGNLIDSDRHGPFRSGSSNERKFYVNAIEVDYPYVLIRFTATPENGWDGDVTISIDGVDLSTTTFSETTSVSAILPREAFSAEEEFTLEITATMTGEDQTSTKQFYITDLYLEAFNRQDMSEECYRKNAFNESTGYPVFEQASSGFLNTDDDLTIEFTIPRQLYDVVIAFEGQQNAQVGYTDASASTSLWASDRTTTGK